MRQVHVGRHGETGEVNPSIRLEPDEVIVVLKETDIVLAVAALRKMAAIISERLTIAMTVEGENPRSDRVDELSWHQQVFDELSGDLIFASGDSWKSSDHRHPESEAYEYAMQRRLSFLTQAGVSEPVSADVPGTTS